MKYGYIRVSTRGQAKEGNSIEAQEAALKAAGAEKFYIDTFSGRKISRPEFDKLLEVLESGDTLMVTKLDRFARTVSEGSELIQKLLKNDIKVHVLNLGVLDNSTTGKLITHVLLCFAEFEADNSKERLAEGKAIAKLDPNYREGRPPKYSKAQLDHAAELALEKGIKESVKLTGISKATIYRHIKSRKCTY